MFIIITYIFYYNSVTYKIIYSYLIKIMEEQKRKEIKVMGLTDVKFKW